VVTEPGCLYINCVGAKNVKNSDMMGASDCYCEMTLSKKSNCSKIITTKTIDNNLNPVWNHEDNFQLNLPKQDYVEVKLFCKVFDYDYLKNSILGKVIIDLDPLFAKAGEWHNKSLILMDENGKGATSGELYVQAQWRPTGINDELLAPPKNLYGEAAANKTDPKKGAVANQGGGSKPDEKKDEKKNDNKPAVVKEDPKKDDKKVDEKIPEKPAGDNKSVPSKPAEQLPAVDASMIEGCLKFSIISGSGFAKSWKDTPDPFCVVSLVSSKPVAGSATKKIKTPVVKDNVTPIWNVSDYIKILMKKEELEPLRIEAVVEDEELIGSSFIGKTLIDPKLIFSGPRKWISEDYNLLDKSGKNVTGKVKIDIMWEPKE
jgi:Ca2+-dependent lipid-binding protein